MERLSGWDPALWKPKVCRICCAADNDDLVSVQLVQGGVAVASMILELTGIRVTADRKLPQSVCLTCLERLGHAYQLRRQCIESDAELRSQLYRGEASENSIQGIVKLEVETLQTGPEELTNEPAEQLDIDTQDECGQEGATRQECSVCYQRFEKNEFLGCGNSLEETRFVCSTCNEVNEEQLVEQHDQKRDVVHPMVIEDVELTVELHGTEPSDNNDSEIYEIPQIEFIEDAATVDSTFAREDDLEVSGEMNSTEAIGTRKDVNKYFPTKERKEMGLVPGNFLRVIEHLEGYNIVEIQKERCCGCLRFFESRKELDKHTKIHRKESLAENTSAKAIKYQCEFCLKAFNIALVYVAHKRIREQKQFYQCGLCSFVIDSESRLKYHMLHNDQHAKYFNLNREDVSQWYQAAQIDGSRCCGCGQYCDGAESLAEHSRKVHPKQYTSSKRMHTCSICKRRFYTQLEVEAHQKKNGSTVRYYCKLCDFETPDEPRILRHLYSSIHNEALPAIVVKNIEIGFRKAGVLRYCCFAECALPFHETEKFHEHVATVHQEQRQRNLTSVGDQTGNRLQCDCCLLVFRTATLLKQHQQQQQQLGGRQGEPKRFVCTVCGVAKPSRTALSTHEMRHTGERPFACNICEKRFTSQTILSSHMKCHAPKQHACPDCGEKFTRGENLKRHISHRHSEATLSCRYCPRMLKTRQALVQHERSHTGEKPFSCRAEGCGKYYSSNTERRRHEMASHTGERPHKCSHCAASFVRKRQLTIHERKHTGERPFVCQSCGKGFIDAPLLKKHCC